MASAEQVLNAGGPVRVGPLTFHVRELSVAGEVGFLNRLRALARDALGPGSFYTRARPAIAWLREQGDHTGAAQLADTVGRLVATGAAASDDLADEFRRSPDGVAEELYWRTRDAHPDATLAEFKAVVNQVNALEVHLGILEALSPKKTPTPSS